MTRRRAQIVLLIGIIAWIVFSVLIAPAIIQSAYDGKNDELFSRLLSGRSAHSVEFYLRRWKVVSWMLLALMTAALVPVTLFNPGQLWSAWKRYWFRPEPLVYLALLRVVAVGAQLSILTIENGYTLRSFTHLVSLPDSIYKPLPALRLFLLPFGLDSRPSSELLTLVFWLTALAGVLALLGWKSRLSLFVFAAGNTFLQAFAYSFGDLHHQQALMIITLWLLVFSPAGGALSLDSYLARRKSPSARLFQITSIFARWPLLLVQNLFALVYLDAALRKLYTGGADWLNGYTLQFYLYIDASRRGSAFGLWLAQQHTLACLLCWVTLLFEGTFFFVLIFPRLVWIYIPLGIGLHLGMCLAKVACFYQFLALYIVFLPSFFNWSSRLPLGRSPGAPAPDEETATTMRAASGQ